jgi:LmbE family N-acetylglucosaminyl deacetylase
VSTIIVVAPHPDDETLGCGGTLLRAIASGARVHWVICTRMTPEAGYSEARMLAREREIADVAAAYGFAGVHQAPFPAARLDVVPVAERVSWFSSVFRQVCPDVLFLPHPHDVHSDHAAVFDAASACTKAFRYPTLRKVHVYETLSETEFDIRPGNSPFNPNRFVDVSAYLERKIKIMELYAGEMAAPPFPRSGEAIRALATLRGLVASCLAAEAFMVMRDIE